MPEHLWQQPSTPMAAGSANLVSSLRGWESIPALPGTQDASAHTRSCIPHRFDTGLV